MSCERRSTRRVIARSKELGGIVNAGEAVFTLIAPDSIWVKAYVDEALAGGLNVGQRAFVRLRSEPDRLFETEIVRIDQENDRVTEERRIYVRCRTCNPQHQLRYLGEQAEVEDRQEGDPERPVRAAQIRRRIRRPLRHDLDIAEWQARQAPGVSSASGCSTGASRSRPTFKARS